MEHRRLDMNLLRRSKVDDILFNSLMIADEQLFYIYGEVTYVFRPYLLVRFKG